MKLLAAILILLSGISGCGGDDPSAPSDVDGIVTDVVVMPPIIREGQTAWLEIKVTNYGSNVVPFSFSSGCWFHFVMTPEDGEPLEELRPCTLAIGYWELKPGESMRQTFLLSPRPPSWMFLPPGAAQLPRGRYKIEAGLLDNENIAPWAEAGLTVRP